MSILSKVVAPLSLVEPIRIKTAGAAVGQLACFGFTGVLEREVDLLRQLYGLRISVRLAVVSGKSLFMLPPDSQRLTDNSTSHGRVELIAMYRTARFMSEGVQRDTYERRYLYRCVDDEKRRTLYS